MPRQQGQTRNRVQRGEGLADVALKIAKALAPSALKIVEGAAEGVGKRVSKLISGEGRSGLQALSADMVPSTASTMASKKRQSGGSAKLAGQKGGRLAPQKKRLLTA